MNKKYILKEIEEFLDNEYINIIEKYNIMTLVMKLIHREFIPMKEDKTSE